jgi:GNAT superfamily N-acetyltransferase
MQGEKSLSDLVIRPFRKTDNSQLIDLAKSIGVPARVKLGVDRSPVFWAFDQRLGTKWDILVAEVDHEIVGFVDMVHTEFLAGDVKKAGTYVVLAGVDLGWRGSAVFHRLLRASEKTARARGSEFAIALVNENNHRLDRMLQLVYKDSIRCEKLRILCILLGPHYRRDSDFSIETATSDVFPEIIQLVNLHYANYQLVPLLREDYFEMLLKNELNEFLVARDSRRRIVATLGLWDQSNFRRTIVVDYALPELWLRNILNSSRYFTRIKRMPDSGGYFSYLYSIFAASELGCEKALAALIRMACKKYANRKYNFLIFSSPESSPFFRCCRGLWRIVNTNIPVVIPLTSGAANFLNEINLRNLYLEYALT